MKKKNRTLIMMLAALIILVVAYAGVRVYTTKQEAKKTAQEAADEIKIVDVSDVSKISYTGESGSMEFEKTDDNWSYVKDSAAPLDQTSVQTMVDTFASITAVKELASPDALADYGLDTPTYEVHLTTEKGTTDLYVGNATGDYDYVTTGDKSKVYTMDATLTDSLIFSINDLLAVDEFPSFAADDLTKAVVTKAGKETTYTSDDDALDNISSEMEVFTFASCEAYNVTKKQLSSYGLDEDSRTTVSLTYKDSDSKEQTVKFYIGSADTSGESYYVQMDGSKNVDTMSADAANAILNQE